MSHNRIGRVLQFAALIGVWLPAACGSVSPGDVPEDTASVSQAFGESTCGAATPDHIFNGPDAIDISNGGTYNDSNCANSFTVEANTSTTGFLAYAAYDNPIVPPSWGCNGMWVNMSLWRYNGIDFVKIADAPYSVGAPSPDGTACLPPSTQIAIPRTGKYKVIGQAGFANSYQAVNVGIVRGDLHDMSFHSDQGYTGEGDWAVGMYKGECNFSNNVGTYIGGVSRVVGGHQSVRNIFCSQPIQGFTSDTTLDISSGRDDRRSTSSGDWDFGFTKAECPQGEVLTALAQTTGGVLQRARCARAADTTDSCTTVTLSNGDDRDSIWGGDWSPGDFKAQCPDNLAATGVSRDANGRVRTLLCCARHGHP